MPSDRYAELLVAEVPAKKQMEALINIWRNKDLNSVENLSYVCKELFHVIGDSQLGDFISLVSDELKIIKNEVWIRISLQLFPPRLWPQVDELARLRIENKLVQSIKDGKYDTDFDTTTSALGTWARDYAKYFTLKVELSEVLADKLSSQDIESQNYVVKYFFSALPVVFPVAVDKMDGNERYKKFKKKMYAEAIVKSALNSDGSSLLRENLLFYLSNFPEDWIDLIIESAKPIEKFDEQYYKKLLNAKTDEFPF